MNNENSEVITSNQIIKEMITIKRQNCEITPEDLYIWVSINSGKSIVDIEGDSSSGIIWSAKQKYI